MSDLAEPIRIEGLRELQAALRDIDGNAQKQLRVVLNDAAELVAGRARRDVPTDSGAARKSIKVKSSQREARVAGGSRRAPYYPWLDYGGKVGISRSVTRPFKRSGRYLYPAYAKERTEVFDRLADSLAELVRDQGLHTDGR